MRPGRVLETVVLAAVLCTSAVASEEDSTASDIARREALSRVVVDDGVSREEAETIASFYFYDYIGIGCGAVGDIENGGDAWRFPARVGFAGARDGEVLVDEVSGSARWGSHPAVKDPLSMLAERPSNKPLQPTGQTAPRG